MSEEEINTIREFLNLCLEDGFYCFIVGGSTFLLDTKKDVEDILHRIKNSPKSVQQYRLWQAKKYISELKYKLQNRTA